MKEYEKRALSLLAGALIFSSVNIDYFIVLILFLLVYVYIRFVNKEGIFLVFFLLPPLFSPLTTNTKPLETQKIYDIRVNVTGSKVEVIGGKLRRFDKEYIINKRDIDLDRGRYEFTYKVDKIDEFYNKYYLTGEVLKYQESFFNRITGSFWKKIRDTNYSVDLEKFAYGVIIGDKSELGEGMKELFRRTGASHLLAISGLHVGIVIAFFLTFFSLLPVSYKMRYALTLVFLTLYALTLQGSPSVQRAYIMNAIFLLSKIFLDKTDSRKSLAFALGISLCFNMSLVFDIAFQLSYLALFAILYLFEKGKNPYLDTIKFSLMIQLALTPVFVYNFNNLPLLNFFTNIAVVFAGGIIIGMLYINLILGYLALSFLLKGIIEVLFDILYRFLEFAEKLPLMSVELVRHIPLYIYIGILGAVIAYPFVKKKRVYMSLLVLPIVYHMCPYRIIENGSYVYFPKEEILVAQNLYDRDKYLELIDKYRVRLLVTDRDKDIDEVKVMKVEEGDVFFVENLEMKYDKGRLTYRYR